MYCISVNYKKTPLQIRQQFAFSQEEQALSSFKQIARENIKKYCLYYQEKKALRHLFRVACGLDSMVLGEDEILHQVKEAYLIARNLGYTNSELNIIFQGALGSGVLIVGVMGKLGSIVAKDLIAKGIPVIGTSRKKLQSGGFYLQDNANMEWLDIDYFNTLSKENNNIKLGELEKVEHVLNECVEEVLKKHYIRVFKEKMAEKCEEEWFQKMAYFPFMIEIEDKTCLVAGGGSIAFHKVKIIVDFGVHIQVVAPEICESLRELANERVWQKENEVNN